MSSEETQAAERPKRRRRRRRRRAPKGDGQTDSQSKQASQDGKPKQPAGGDGARRPPGDGRPADRTQDPLQRRPATGRSGDRDRAGGERRERRGRGRPKKGRPKTDAALALEAKPPLDESKDKDEPLSPAEAEQMKEHFKFISRHRRILRLKLNANEDLLVNGARPPKHRGVCLHLLKKIDRGCVSRGVARLSDPEAKLRLLAGVVKFSNDVAIVLLYLELLAATQTKTHACDALAVGLKHIDFAAASASQMRRVLDLIVSLFDQHERPQLLFGLLQAKSFRAAFDESIEGMPAELADIVAPLRAVYAVILKGNKNPLGPEVLASGVELLLGASSEVLASYPEKVRQRLFEHGAQLTDPPKALRRLLDAFPKESRQYSNMGMSLARQLLARGADEQARQLLEEIAANHPGFRQPGAWLEALRGTRIGRVVVTEAIDIEEEASPGRLRPGFWLDRQSTVWLRVGATADAENFAREAALHRQLLLPDVAPLMVAETTGDGVPYLAVAAVGSPVEKILSRRKKRVDESLVWVRDGALLLHAVAQAGVILPDVELRRFLLSRDNRLWLGNLDGARGAGESAAKAAHLQLAKSWCGGWLERLAGERATALDALLAADGDWPALAEGLAELAY